jgi:hypothetical protein
VPQPTDDAEIPAWVRDQAYEWLTTARTGTMITFPPGEPFPRLRGMGFTHKGWILYMSTRRKWRKAREVAANPHVTVLFNDTTIRRDHFIQIDCRAFEVSGDEFDEWQEMRFQKEGDALRRAAAGMSRDDWVGWRLEPVRVRINGYVRGGRYSEAPVVLRRPDLGLPPLD